MAAYCLAGAHLLRNKGDVEGAVAAARGWLTALLQGGEQGAGTVLEWLEVGGAGSVRVSTNSPHATTAVAAAAAMYLLCPLSHMARSTPGSFCGGACDPMCLTTSCVIFSTGGVGAGPWARGAPAGRVHPLGVCARLPVSIGGPLAAGRDEV